MEPVPPALGAWSLSSRLPGRSLFWIFFFFFFTKSTVYETSGWGLCRDYSAPTLLTLKWQMLKGVFLEHRVYQLGYLGRGPVPGSCSEAWSDCGSTVSELNWLNSLRLLRTVEGHGGSCRKLLRARLASVLPDHCKHPVHENPVLLTHKLQGRLQKLASLCAQEKGYELWVCQNMELSLLSLLCQWSLHSEL